LGVAYAVTESNGLAMVAVTSRASSLGTAYGLVGCGVSLALVLEPYTVGWIKSASGSYDGATAMFIFVSASGAAMAAAVALFDARHARLMCTAPAAHEQALQQRRNSKVIAPGVEQL
jgi:hypothetical protein